MSYKLVILAVLITAISVPYARALKCYTCSVAGSQQDKCIDDPANVPSSPSKTCNKKYCYTFRIDMKEEDEVVSMVRSCDDVKPCEPGVSEDSTFRYYCTICSKDLCNDGNGKTPSSSSGLHSYSDGVGVLRVPGVGGGATTYAPNLFLFAVMLGVTKLINYL